MVEETKRCSQCECDLPLGDFRLGGVHKNGKRYRASHCHSCHAANGRAYRAQNLEACRARELEYAHEHADKKRANALRYYYARYDADPIWRIELLMRKARRARAVTLAKRRAAA